MGWYDRSDPFEGIEGKVLNQILVSRPDQSTLTLRFADDIRVVTTEGDCCSESWWADITGASSAYGGIIVGVEQLEFPDDFDDGRSRQECDSLYGWQIKTDKGVVDLIFRNSSNGYYGGTAYAINPPENGMIWDSIETNNWSA